MYQAHLVLQKSDILYETGYGNVLIVKMVLVVALIITYAIHVRIIRKDVEDQIMTNKISEIQFQKLRKKIIILGDITVVLCVFKVFLAALLNSGGEI